MIRNRLRQNKLVVALAIAWWSLAVISFIAVYLLSAVLADSALDINVHDTYFVVEGGFIETTITILWLIFGLLCFGVATVVHRVTVRWLLLAHVVLSFPAVASHFYMLFYSRHFLGLAGLPGRYYSNSEFPEPSSFVMDWIAAGVALEIAAVFCLLLFAAINLFKQFRIRQRLS